MVGLLSGSNRLFPVGIRAKVKILVIEPNNNVAWRDEEASWFTIERTLT